MFKLWIEALRLKVSLLAFLLAIASYRLSHVDISWFAVASVFFITVVTMVQNDWRDRFHDVQKGKLLASSNPRAFLGLLCVLWVATTCFIVVVALQDVYAGALLSAMAVVALVYSETRQIPFLPISLVSLTSASPVLLPLTSGADLAPIAFLFCMVALVTFGREVFGDLDDRDIDKGYKSTIAVAASVRRPDVLAAVAILAGTFLAETLVHWILLPGVLLSQVGVCALAYNAHSKWSWRCLDGGLALIILPLIVYV
jgi:4-hydroxybenzoate polyprenyltransferase